MSTHDDPLTIDSIRLLKLLRRLEPDADLDEALSEGLEAGEAAAQQAKDAGPRPRWRRMIVTPIPDGIGPLTPAVLSKTAISLAQTGWPEDYRLARRLIAKTTTAIELPPQIDPDAVEALWAMSDQAAFLFLADVDPRLLAVQDKARQFRSHIARKPLRRYEKGRAPSVADRVRLLRRITALSNVSRELRAHLGRGSDAPTPVGRSSAAITKSHRFLLADLEADVIGRTPKIPDSRNLPIRRRRESAD